MIKDYLEEKMNYKAFLVKYAEIGVKGNNRHIFEKALRDRILQKLSPLGDYHVVREQGRIFIECPDVYDYEDTIEALKHTFGVWGFSPVVVIEQMDWENLVENVCEYVGQCYENKNFTFKIEAKRADKQYAITSPEMCSKLGEALLERFLDLRVDVHNPEKRITLEVRKRAYIYSETIKGPGGMPIGTAGSAMLLLSGGIDSPVAGYQIAKRGVVVNAVYFHAPPYTSERAKQKVVDLAKQLSKYTDTLRLYIVNFTKIQMEIYETCPHEQLTILMRRFMMRIAQVFAEKENCLGLVTGESIGQVASQTMHSLFATNAVCTMPVYRPLIGLDKEEIVVAAKKIGTYETSILPYEDCCTIFVAKHPVTHPNLSSIEKSELLLDEHIKELITEAVESAELLIINP